MIATRIVNGEQVIPLRVDTALVASKSQPGAWHMVKAGTCNCKGFQYRRSCRHIKTIVEGGSMATQIQPHTCKVCGRTGAFVLKSVEHVGGQGNVELWRCANGAVQSCRQTAARPAPQQETPRGALPSKDVMIARMNVLTTATAMLSSGGRAVEPHEAVALAGKLEKWICR